MQVAADTAGELQDAQQAQAGSAAEVKRLLTQLTRLEENAEADLQRAADEVSLLRL